MHHLHIDIETQSGYDLTACGVYKYVESEDFKIQLIGYAIDNEPVQLIDLTKGDDASFIIGALTSSDFLKYAFNAEFEITCLYKFFNLPPQLDQWRDTMIKAAYFGVIGSLETVGAALGVPEDKAKLKTGRALIKLFSKPDKTGAWTLPEQAPDKWELYRGYNIQDVEAERYIDSLMPDAPEMLWREWREHVEMNRIGVALDAQLIDNAIDISSNKTGILFNEARLMYGIENPGSPAQIKAYAKSRGMILETLARDTLEKTLQRSDIPDDIRRLIEIRLATAKSSVAKYNKAKGCICRDGRARGLLSYYGAKTGRFSGKLIQVQNLPRISMNARDLAMARELTKAGDAESLGIMFNDVNDTLSQLCRTMFVPAEGKKYIDADFSSIEARVLAWLAGEEWSLEVFRTHGKIYEAQASQMFNVPLERIKKGNPEYSLRAKGKIAVLALGYQGSIGALINLGALDMGIPEYELQDIVDKWRSTNRRCVKFWYDIEKAFKLAINKNHPVKVRRVEVIPGHDRIAIKLPSQRAIYYLRPRIEKDKIIYTGTSQTTGKLTEIETYGGKLTENIVQAIARDCLVYKLRALKSAGYTVVFHIHDEVVCECEKAQTLQDIVSILKKPIAWCSDLPLNADGWEGYYFTKD